MPDPSAVNSMFSRIAGRYDLANRLLSGGADIRWRKKLVERVKCTAPGAVLDLATGSGDVAFALADALPGTTEIIGADFCQPMLEQAEAKKNARAAGTLSNVSFQIGDALALPFSDGRFDAITIAFGLRNLADRIAGLAEMRRVLLPGGRLFVLEFSQPERWFRPLYYLYLRRILPMAAGVVTGDRAAYVYLNDTISEFPDREQLETEFTKAGFSSVKACAMTFGIVALHEAVK
jgi:demethylmenaquinone methyltransferase / 2-methoxy-6-polyprenyl-1,4-benzoquinol methylase